MKEYERKFLCKHIPNLNHIKPVIYERYFTYIGEDGQVRIQKRGKKCEIESYFGKYKKKILITEEAFNELTKDCNNVIKRENYSISDNIKIKLYKGNYEGLVIVDVQFSNAEQFYNYIKPNWLGAEITSTELGKDGNIIQLSPIEVLQKIKFLQQEEELNQTNLEYEIEI